MGTGGAELKDFLGVVDRIFAGDSHYIRPIDLDIKERLDPKKNPFFEHAEGTIFMAYEGRKCVGRITAQIDREHLDRHKDQTGFFGFFDTVDDPEVARALLTRAESWLRQRGMKKVRGPYSLSINEESGCLVEGFDAPPVLQNPHHRSYQGQLIEQAGYTKEKDLFGWRYEVGDLNPRVRKARDDIRAMPEVKSRPLSKKDLSRDVAITLDIFNDAWSDNWGFVPLTKKEAAKMQADLKLFLLPEITRIVTIDGEPAAVALAMPNINELIPDLHGKLFPLGIAKLLYRLKVEGAKSGRLLILGIRKKWRHVRRYAGVSAYLYVEMNRSAHLLGKKDSELGWTLEDNAAINAGIRLMGGRIAKRYRVYEKAL